MKKDTVGKVSIELIEKSVGDSHTANDQMREQLVDYEGNMAECLQRCKGDYVGDFFIVVLTKKEKLLKNVIRNYFTGRQTCPTPNYDQAVYRYNSLEDSVEFLWVVPARDVCIYMISNALTVPEEERELLGFVMDFADETLLRLAKKLNGEQDDSPLLVKG